VITTEHLIERLTQYAERQERYAARAARGENPIISHAAAADMAAKAELLRSLIVVSQRDDERRADRG
jgi:hypothetical protein